MTAPDGRQSRILIRDTWNTDIVEELKPEPGDIVIYKTRYSGFYGTDLDAVLKTRGIKSLVITGVSTGVCVESTLRDAMFRDYRCLYSWQTVPARRSATIFRGRITTLRSWSFKRYSGGFLNLPR